MHNLIDVIMENQVDYIMQVVMDETGKTDTRGYVNGNIFCH